MGQAPPQRHGSCYGHAAEGGRSTTGNQTTSSDHVLHVYTHLKNGSGKVSLVVGNVSDSHIFLKKEVPVA